MNNKKNNKGFSLVELIVVVAIMAVLVGVLAPAYLRYVEKTRVQKDVSAVSEVVSAIKVAAADETINKEIATGEEVEISATGAISSTGAPALATELGKTIGTVNLTSDALKGKVVTITMTKTDGNITLVVTDNSDATADTTFWANVK